MEVRHFKPHAPGELIAIVDGKRAFLPKPLPPDWEFPSDLWPLLSEAKQQVGVLEGVGRTLPNPAILLRPLTDREAIRSSRLEGTYVSTEELLLFEFEEKEGKSEQSQINNTLEVINYRRALNHGVTSHLPISLRLIRELHEILMRGVRGRDRTPGEFRRTQVAIGSSERFIPPPPEKIMELLNPLEQYLHTDRSHYDPLVDCFLAHYQFETIHPFVDGNGRVGRLLLAMMLKERCQLSKPWLYMSEFYERHSDEYIDHLYTVSTDANWHDWIEFCLRGTVMQAKDTIERCDRLLTIRDDFMRRIEKVGGTVRLNRIVEGIFDSPFIQVAPLAHRLGVTYPTAKSDINRLVSAGILKALTGIKRKTFYSPEVFAVAYEELEED